MVVVVMMVMLLLLLMLIMMMMIMMTVMLLVLILVVRRVTVMMVVVLAVVTVPPIWLLPRMAVMMKLVIDEEVCGYLFTAGGSIELILQPGWQERLGWPLGCGILVHFSYEMYVDTCKTLNSR